MKDGKILPELKPDEKLRKYLKDRDAKVINKIVKKSPSELKSEAMRKRLDRKAK